MGGAHVAGGDAAELVGRGPGAGADGARGLAGDVAESAAEGAQAAPAGPEGDLGDGEVGVAEECGRPLDAAGEQVAVRGEAEGLGTHGQNV